MEENNNSGLHPFGENPFGEGFVPGDSIFSNASKENGAEGGSLQESGAGEEKVCPHCGTKLEGEDTYCMLCGMTVAPVLRKDYEKALSEANGGYGGGTYGGGNYGGGTYGGGTYGGPGNIVPNRSVGPVPRIKEENPLIKIFVAAITIVALFAVMFFAYKGFTAATAEQVVRMSMKGVSGNASIDETVTLYAKGDKMTRALDEVKWDVSSYDQRTIDMTIKLFEQQYEEIAKLDFVTYEMSQVGDTIYIKLDYNYLDVVKNMQTMKDKKMLVFANKSGDVTYKDYISLKNSVKMLEGQGYKKE